MPYNGLLNDNEGGAMDVATGIFTVPVNGIYEFWFHGLLSSNTPADYTRVVLIVNGAYKTQAHGNKDHNFHQMAMSAIILPLKAGDQVATQSHPWN